MDKIAVDVKRTNLPATAVVFPLDDGFLPDFAAPGSIELSAPDFLLLACPGCGHVSGMRVGSVKPAQSPSWEMHGGSPLLTLSPSINCTGCCGWHGYLKAGVFESC